MIAGCLVLASFPVADASAARQPCKRRGYTLITRAPNFDLLWRKQRGRHWSWGPYITYVCSYRYGRYVRIGINGHSPGRQQGTSWETASSRYAAWVDWHSGAFDYGSDTSVNVVDMMTGRRVSKSPTAATLNKTYVYALAVNEIGWAGWISSSFDDNQTKIRTTRVWRRTPSKLTEVAIGPQIDQNFLHFDERDRELVWSTRTQSGP